LYNNLDSWEEYSLALGQLKKEGIEGVLLTPLRILQMRRAFIAAFTTMDDNHKKFIPQLAIDTEFCQALYDVKPKVQSDRCAPYCALATECLMTNYCIRWRGIFKGLSQDGGRKDFSKNPLRHFL
jgi:hypothetical protein